MQAEGSLQRLIKGLLWIGTGFLIGAALAIVWAVFQTSGVDDFLTALMVAGLGFGLPAVVAFSVAWLLSSFEEAEGEHVDDNPIAALPRPAQSVSQLILSYAIAVCAVGLAWAIRAWLNPFVSDNFPFITFFLAVAVAGWLGGLGPVLLATVLSLGISWFYYLPPRGAFRVERLEDLVGLGVFLAVALCVGGITAALRAAREQSQHLVRLGAQRHDELERTRADLARERDRFEVILRSIGDAVIATDAKGRVTFLNPAAEQLTGWKAEEAQGGPLTKMFRVVNEQTHAPADSPVDQVIASGRLQALDDDTLLLARNGREIPIQDSAAPIMSDDGGLLGVVLVFRDITAAKQQRAALRESEARFRVLADQVPAMIWTSDTTKDCIFFNRTWLDFTGRTPELEKGDGWSSGVHPDDFAHCLGVYATAFDAREPFAMEYRLRRHDGEYRWVYHRGTPRFDGNGEFAGYIGACMDITERKSTESVLNQADRRKNEFIATLAHELRNPLAPIRNAVQIIARLTTGRDPRLDHAREVLDRQSAHLTRLIDDLLDVARIDSGKIVLKRETLSLQDIVNQAIDVAEPLIRERGHRVTLALPDATVWLDGDRTRLVQVIGNLLNNAAKFTPDGGRIELSAQVVDDHVEIVVADNGAGIEAALLPQVFDLFEETVHTARQPQSGLGLGLTIVRRLVEMHGGSVTAASDGAGKGSRFTLRLPIKDSAAAPQARKPERTNAPARVLVVDDNVDAAAAIATLLEMSGHTVSVVHNPKQALEAATTTSHDVIVLDIGLPGMSGYELAGKLRAPPVNTRARLVALTGYGQAADETQAKQAGFAGYLVKPVDADQLTALVADLARRERVARK